MQPPARRILMLSKVIRVELPEARILLSDRLASGTQ
jgi:hypothetical protein